MKNCGRRFHSEVGKFKFLNELIKVVSPKVSNMFHQNYTVKIFKFMFPLILRYTSFIVQYLGDKVSEKVKNKVIEMLFSWTVSLPDEAKICEAYQMLKSQGETSSLLKSVRVLCFLVLEYLKNYFNMSFCYHCYFRHCFSRSRNLF